MGIVDKVLVALQDKDERARLHEQNVNRKDDGPAALALGKPAEYTVDDKVGGDHTRIVKDAVLKEKVSQHAHHEVTPIVDRVREETEIHQKVQPVVDNQEIHTHHAHVAPTVSRHVQEDVSEDHAARYAAQARFQNEQTIGEQTHSTSVNAPIVREHINKHIIEEIQPVIMRQTQKVEHHHTTQQIQEVHVKAPVVHTIVEAAPISMAEFTGKVASLGSGHLGHKHTTSSGSSHSLGRTAGVGAGAGALGAGRSGYRPRRHRTASTSSYSSSDDEKRTVRNGQPKKSLAQKAKEAISGNKSSTSTSTSSRGQPAATNGNALNSNTNRY